MSTQMNIKSEEARELAEAVAALSGVSITQGIVDSLRARKRQLEKAEKLRDVMFLCEDTAGRLDADAATLDHGTLLYGASGSAA